MKKPISPCKDCAERYFKCHSTCDGYQSFVIEQEKYRKNISDKKGINNKADSVRIMNLKKPGNTSKFRRTESDQSSRF